MKNLPNIYLAFITTISFSSSSYATLYNTIVAKDNTGNYQYIQEAIDKAPKDNSPYTIYIKNGIYNEKLEIERPNIYLIGENKDSTIITSTTANGMKKEDGTNWGTTGSRTVNINAENFKARNLTIANGFDYPSNQRKADDDPTKIRSTQAVALLISDLGKYAQFKNINLVGYQDTLYLKSSASYFDHLKISGHVDFIFGYGTALFENTEIITRDHSTVLEGEPYGFITAPATNINNPFGLVFKNCQIKKETPDIPADSFALGRPWHPTTTFDDGRYADPNAIGHAAFINCSMDDHIYGWDKMSGKDINQNIIWFYPEDSRFWEYQSTGKGAVNFNETGITDEIKTAYRPQLTKTQLVEYSKENILSGWLPDISLSANTQLKGEVLNSLMIFPANISVIDSSGEKRETQTDNNGSYHINIDGMTLPIIISVDDTSGISCLKSDEIRSLCMASFINNVNNGDVTTANINPFTDVIVSAIATSIGIDGPQQLVEKGYVPPVPLSVFAQAQENFQQAFAHQFALAGLNDISKLSPESYPEKYSDVMKNLTNQVLHNRGYTTSTGLASSTTLTNLAFHPILSLDPNPKYQLGATSLEAIEKQVSSADIRIFLVGDSTVSNYEPDVYPRMGWGQVFDSLYSNGNVIVINAARSGRSSRDFINGRWLSSIEPYVQAGDYLFIEFSHNDEKCNEANGSRGPIDVANLCTYPNSPTGKPQYPEGKPHYSFQHSLERYLQFARQYKMQPILLTATARAKTQDNKLGTPINPVQHITKQNKNNGYMFFGNYTQTVIDTAQKHNIPLIDLQSESIKLGNEAKEKWTDIWLAVDPEKYPYYQEKTGRLDKPDTTHFQQYGATLITQKVVEYIKNEPELETLADALHAVK